MAFRPGQVDMEGSSWHAEAALVLLTHIPDPRCKAKVFRLGDCQERLEKEAGGEAPMLQSFQRRELVKSLTLDIREEVGLSFTRAPVKMENPMYRTEQIASFLKEHSRKSKQGLFFGEQRQGLSLSHRREGPCPRSFVEAI